MSDNKESDNKENDNKEKVISVIIPCYNVEKYIDRCLQSVVLQTIGLNALEIICVDDCSTDNTYERLLFWEQKYPDNFMIIQSPQNGRQGQARNIGLSYASTEWICFLDSDDWIELDYLTSLYKFAMTGKYDVVCCDAIRDKTLNVDFEQISLTAKENHNYSYQDIKIDTDEKRKKLIITPLFGYSAWGKLVSKSILIENQIEFPENLTYEDAFWGSILHMYITSGVKIEANLYHYFVNESSTVLSSNQFHHLDCITVQTMLWNEWEKRGFFKKYQDELEIEHIYSAYLPGIKMLILRFAEPNYNGYLLLRYLILQRIPDYENNLYIKKGIMQEKYMHALTALKYQLNKKQFTEFAENLKKIGI